MDLSCMREGVDECVIQVVVMVVSVRLVQGVLKQQQERVYLFRIRKKELEFC